MELHTPRMLGTRMFAAAICFTLSSCAGYRGGWSALDAVTGAILWETPNPAYERGMGPVSGANGVVYACSMDSNGHMYALDAASGSVEAGNSIATRKRSEFFVRTSSLARHRGSWGRFGGTVRRLDGGIRACRDGTTACPAGPHREPDRVVAVRRFVHKL